nr:hypothetical protein K-LCC10_0015 [Kaumoebavirus]
MWRRVCPEIAEILDGRVPREITDIILKEAADVHPAAKAYRKVVVLIDSYYSGHFDEWAVSSIHYVNGDSKVVYRCAKCLAVQWSYGYNTGRGWHKPAYHQCRSDGCKL